MSTFKATTKSQLPLTAVIAKRFYGDYPPHELVEMPALSPSMEVGNLIEWLVKEGDEVTAGTAVAKMETDKAVMDFEFQEDGYVAKLLVPNGTEEIAVGTPIFVLAESADDIAAFKDFKADGAASSTASGAAKEEKKSEAPKKEKKQEQELKPVNTKSPPPKKEQNEKQEQQQTNQGDRVFASPLARVGAREKGIDLSQVKGTGPNQRIVAADVAGYTPSTSAKKAAAPKVEAMGDSQDMPISSMRRVIAERLSFSKQNIPHYYLTIECNMDNVLKLRAELNEKSKGEYKLSVNDFIVKASALALKKVPECNSSWGDKVIKRYSTVDINVAVSSPDGLYTPLVSNADMRGLTSISAKVRELADKAKDKTVSPAELAPGSFTISNLGMFGISQFAAVINPPQSCILAVGATQQKVIPNTDPSATGENKFKVVQVMSVTLSCDHRVVDGAVGAKWLQHFKEYTENPIRMLL